MQPPQSTTGSAFATLTLGSFAFVVLASRDGTLSHVLVVAREARTREHVEADARVHAHVGQTHVQVLPPQSMRTTGGAAKTVCNLGSMRSHGFYDNIANRAVEAHSPHCTLDPSIAGAWIRTDGALATSMIDKGVLWAQEPLSARRSPSIPPLALAVPDGLPPDGLPPMAPLNGRRRRSPVGATTV